MLKHFIISISLLASLAAAPALAASGASAGATGGVSVGNGASGTAAGMGSTTGSGAGTGVGVSAGSSATPGSTDTQNSVNAHTGIQGQYKADNRSTSTNDNTDTRYAEHQRNHCPNGSTGNGCSRGGVTPQESSNNASVNSSTDAHVNSGVTINGH